MTPGSIGDWLSRTLPRVARPGRYAGGELNSVVKSWDSAAVRLALAFPDLYDLGMSNLGLAILYEIINDQPDMLAERVFSPWVDMEQAMRQENVPLFALESRHPVAEFDVIGISLPYEQLYSNVLNLLDLSGLPVLASERDSRHPLVVAGGHAAFNPEPMSQFIDAFAIGDGEEVILDILRKVAAAKRAGASRMQLLRELASVGGVYVPSLYQIEYHPDGTPAKLRATDPAAAPSIQKRVVALLPPPPTRPIVPSIRTTHNRAVIEIMRGCTRGCRFCHAGFVTRPVRERPPAEVAAAVERLLDHTGYEEIALLSLSSSDYTNILPLVQTLSEHYQDLHLSISLPSLRIESSSADLMEAVSGGRRSGITFAPEAATERMRGIINKEMPESQLLQVASEVFSRGWRTIKLYFMIGQPQETIQDVEAIAGLAREILRLGRKHHGRKAAVHLGVSTFIPKPHTPFQWAALDTHDRIADKLDLLKNTTGGRGLELKWNDPDETLVEAMLSRGDRRLGPVIHRAWQMGARFDGWNEHFDLERWQTALTEHGLTMSFYNHRPRRPQEILPWDHIDTGVNKPFLLHELERSRNGATLSDCRAGCHACGILTAFRAQRDSVADSAWQCP